MKTKMRAITFSIVLLVFFATMPQHARAQDSPKAAAAKIYDESSNAATQISDALEIAKKDHKRILLDFGANWCIWCHRLHDLFESNGAIARELKKEYVLVMIDVHNTETDAKYGQPTKLGLPVIVILDADGKQVTTQDTGKLEEGDHHSPKKVMAFLKEWAQKRPLNLPKI
jgi:thiol:disulfide interchange protein